MNILLLITDQQTHTALSIAGTPNLHTPHLDTLAASGTRFTRAYCASPVCGPSRACLATGRLPHENGVIFNGMSVYPDTSTIGEVFKDAGYETAWTGRWCVPGNGPDIRGFDCLHDPDAPLGQGILGDAHVADRAVDFLSRNHARPFLLGVSLCNPHDICYWVMQQSTPRGDLDPHTVALKKKADSIDFAFAEEGDLPPLPDNFAVDPDEPEFIARCRMRPHYGQEGTFTWDWSEETWRRYLRAYARLTERVDALVGRVTAALADADLADDTLFLVTSDHGEGLAAHRWVVKLSFNEEVTRVPLILSHPDAVPVGRCDRLASGIDVLPTLCDYADIPCPDVTGRSLKPAVEGKAGRDHLVVELHPDPSDPDFQGRSLVTARHKYNAYTQGRNPEQLFDLHADPGESRNLARDPAAADILTDHRNLLADHLAASSDPFTCPELGAS